MDKIKQHLIDFLKGLLAAMVTSACLAAFQYIGAHISDLISFTATAVAATSTIKLTR